MTITMTFYNAGQVQPQASPLPVELNRVANEPKQLGTESESCLEQVALKTSVIKSDLQFLMYFIAKIENALSKELKSPVQYRL
ncbi:hypothetical protein T07_5361 [Trichinella nelsoni]|uniref:Uncharacterized protein n=1 Tax=Trichinella nelsoni TaxID=6336 RepID=A0A0V0SBB4_9BILA|nr:hypothetical protein T07_5361 [Trichinella nelsoni]